MLNWHVLETTASCTNAACGFACVNIPCTGLVSRATEEADIGIKREQSH